MEHTLEIIVNLLGNLKDSKGEFKDFDRELATATVHYAVHDDDCSTFSIVLDDDMLDEEYQYDANEGEHFELTASTSKKIDLWVSDLDAKYFD